MRKFYYGQHCRAEELIQHRLQLLAQAKRLTTDAAVVAAQSLLVKSVAHELAALPAILAEYDQQIAALFAAQADFKIWDSFPGAGAALAPRLLPCTKLGSLVRFERAECDRALEAFKTRAFLPKGAAQRVKLRDRTSPRNWRTKAQIAQHFQISLRTVTNMMAKQALPYVKIGNLVRFDLAECDELLQRCKHRSRFQDWETSSPRS